MDTWMIVLIVVVVAVAALVAITAEPGPAAAGEQHIGLPPWGLVGG